MANPRGSAEGDGDPAGLAAPAAQPIIGNLLRLPEARCEGGACGARFQDPAALGEADLRVRAMAAGWREDLIGLLTCPACQQRAPWPDAFRRGRRAAHAQPPHGQPPQGQPPHGQSAYGEPAPGQASHGQPAGGPAAPYQPAPYQPAGPQPGAPHPAGRRPVSEWPARTAG